MRWRLAVAFGWTAAVFTALLILPVYSNGATLLAVSGSSAFLGAGIPALIAAAPLVWSRQARIPAGAAVAVFVVVAGGSIGLFYAPAAVILLWPHGEAAAPGAEPRSGKL